MVFGAGLLCYPWGLSSQQKKPFHNDIQINVSVPIGKVSAQRYSVFWEYKRANLATKSSQNWLNTLAPENGLVGAHNDSLVRNQEDLRCHSLN